jgi:hypothetical protein
MNFWLCRFQGSVDCYFFSLTQKHRNVEEADLTTSVTHLFLREGRVFGRNLAAAKADAILMALDDQRRHGGRARQMGLPPELVDPCLRGGTLISRRLIWPESALRDIPRLAQGASVHKHSRWFDDVPGRRRCTWPDAVDKGASR